MKEAKMHMFSHRGISFGDWYWYASCGAREREPKGDPRQMTTNEQTVTCKTCLRVMAEDKRHGVKFGPVGYVSQMHRDAFKLVGEEYRHKYKEAIKEDYKDLQMSLLQIRSDCHDRKIYLYTDKLGQIYWSEQWLGGDNG